MPNKNYSAASPYDNNPINNLQNYDVIEWNTDDSFTRIYN